MSDAHASSCTLAVIGPSGKRLGSHVVEANAAPRAVTRRVYKERGQFARGVAAELRRTVVPTPSHG